MKRAQVIKVVDYETVVARRDFDERREAIYAEHSSKGALRSGTTIRRVVRLMEEIAGRFVSESVGKVAAVSRNPDSFGEIAVGLKTLWDYFEVELHSTCKIAGGRGPMHSSDQTIANAAQKLFAKSRSIVHSKLDLLRFTFPLRVEAPTAPPINDSPVVDTPTPQLRKGGRPLAEHWDDMWAAIAVALYEGDLKPKTQADIERAMHIWIDERGLEAATSTVRQRARRLWDRMTMQDG